MITQEEWQFLLDARKIQEKVEDHITSCLQEIWKIFGGELGTWYFPGADEGQMGEMRIYEFWDSISIVTESDKNPKTIPRYISDGFVVDFVDHFPIPFLFVPVADVVAAVQGSKNQEGQRLSDEKKKVKEAALAKLSDEKKKVKEAALAKLTQEERKALGV